MVNEERLRNMIKMSKFDTNSGKQCKPMMQYARKDYVSLELLKSFITGTICYIILLGMWGLYSMQELMIRLATNEIISLFTSVFIGYLLFMVVYLAATFTVSQLRYSSGRKKVKRYYTDLKKVSQMYERDEKIKTPDSKAWE